MARSVRWPRDVRLLVLFGIAACGPPPHATPLPELVPEERPPTWLDRTVSLRTMLGRAGIALDTGGPRRIVESKECETGPARRCVRCTLLDERDGLPDSALEELVAAFARYPITLLDAAKIERVALCKRLDTDEDDEPAAPGPGTGASTAPAPSASAPGGNTPSTPAPRQRKGYAPPKAWR